MFCPRCGSTQSNDLKFCKACGANLNAVRQVVDAPGTSEKFDWSRTWVAEMFMSSEEAQRKQIELERQRGITPATRRYQEIKAGIITSSAGLGVGAVLFALMEGIIASGSVSTGTAQILSSLWVVGIIPVLVGLALIVNGYFISRKIVELAKQNPLHPNELSQQTEPHQLRAADTAEFIASPMSVTEGTTKHLSHPQK